MGADLWLLVGILFWLVWGNGEEDLAQDYVDLAASYQGLGYLESGITESLNRFAERMLDFSTLLKDLVSVFLLTSATALVTNDRR